MRASTRTFGQASRSRAPCAFGFATPLPSQSIRQLSQCRQSQQCSQQSLRERRSSSARRFSRFDAGSQPVRQSSFGTTRLVHSTPEIDAPPEIALVPETTSPTTDIDLTSLPVACPGCGALTQWIEPNQAGYYAPGRKGVRTFVSNVAANEAAAVARTEAKETDVKAAETDELSFPSAPKVPLCDRCHNLIHYNTGTSIDHPPIEAIEQTIEDSPFRQNHIYHVLDAVDFPLSLIPNLYRSLNLRFQRSKNRRSSIQHRHGNLATVSFVITRSDLLAPQKEQVDKMMPYITSVLRDALGPFGENARLGNVHCVSSMRGWWTKPIKEEILQRGGGNWLVGKVNVGKSSLFGAIFPKGTVPFTRANDATDDGLMPFTISGRPLESGSDAKDEDLTLLPPVPAETPYPDMPIVHSLPGTTASPVRLSFGRGKGEVIDLPGLSRGDFELHVKDDLRREIVMTSRPKPEQLTMKPGQSLLLGGLVRITPRDDRHTFLSASFTKLPPHITTTEKAIEIQEQRRETGVSTFAAEGVGSSIASAGLFDLKWDVTRYRIGSLGTRVKVEQLAFQIFAADILIEGCGWVEVAVQVRRRERELQFRPPPPSYAETPILLSDAQAQVAEFPQIEVFSPNGNHVGVRAPMNAYALIEKKPGRSKLKGRPRPSKKGEKKQMKARARAAAAQG